jgi:hypothetical protein
MRIHLSLTLQFNCGIASGLEMQTAVHHFDKLSASSEQQYSTLVSTNCLQIYLAGYPADPNQRIRWPQCGSMTTSFQNHRLIADVGNFLTHGFNSKCHRI